ncbi:MAG: glycosyltransferase family 39 protein [bacterium]|nr:glycosyltransferase family 39 protein [bacterium]
MTNTDNPNRLGDFFGGDRATTWSWLVLVGLVALAAAIRMPFALGSDFPLGDGGYTLSLIEDVRAADYRLPIHGSYNHDSIPFVYPPLALYLGAAMADLGLSEPLTTLRILPAVLGTLTVAAFYLLAVLITGSRSAALWSAASFALFPRAFRWLIMGAGLPRSVGLLLALTALALMHRAFSTGSRRYIVAAGVAGGLTVLSHPEAVLFYSGCAVVLWMTTFCTMSTLRQLLGVACVAAVVVAPWALVIVFRHGLTPQIAALRTMSEYVSLSTIPSRFEPAAGFYLLAFIGACVAVARRKFLLPGWMLLMLLLFHRGNTCWLAIPVCLLVGTAFENGLIPALRNARWGTAGVVMLVVGTFGYGLVESRRFMAADRVAPVPVEDRAAMQWIERQTSSTARFAILPAELYLVDDVGEWMPAVSGRINLFLMQGTEWMEGNVYFNRFQRQTDAVQAVHGGVASFDQWARRQDDMDYLYVPSRSVRHPAMRQILGYLSGSSDFVPVYSDNAFIFERRRPTP